ncbi:AraC family transcriptional regulator [Sphingobacterium sp. Mn56C]|uniref:AraC family transcriptional regulator n=1 Tax=Sphingobacterium sp. Mn56C TaxID=3395261 RepID=UPI003BDECF68
MRAIKTELTPFIQELMKVDVRNQAFLCSPYHAQPAYHAHPELELVFIRKGHGKRIIGNTVEPFEAGDMVFIGSNVPHLWLSDPAYYTGNGGMENQAIVSYFNAELFMDMFKSIKEFDSIRMMIKQSSKGIKIFGQTRDLIAEKLQDLATAEGFKKIEGLLQVMHLISESDEKVFIDAENRSSYEDADSDRLVLVLKYIKERLSEQISLPQVSEVACMTQQSFCRFFKKRMKKSFTKYLNEQRVELAKERLKNSNDSIGNVALSCGFNSSTHFCFVFKEITGDSPRQFRAKLVELAS